MFEELFKNPHTVQRYRAAPLVEPRERYLRHLAESGARRLTLRQIALDQVRLLHLLDLREGGKIAVAQIEAIAPKWDRTRHHKLGHRPRTSRKSLKRALSRVTRWLRFLDWLDEPEEDRHPYSVELGAFEEWMRAERCLAEETIGNSLRSAREFLDWLTAHGKHLESVRIADVDAAIEAKQTGRQYSRVTIRGYAKRLRAFVRFAENRGWCTSGMAEGIVPPRFYPDEKVRSTLSRDDVRRLLATTDGDRRGDTRDRAILMLLIVYGLRAGEVRSFGSTTSTGKTRRCACAAPRPGGPISSRSPRRLDKPSFDTLSRSAGQVANGLCSSPSRHRSDRWVEPLQGSWFDGVWTMRALSPNAGERTPCATPRPSIFSTGACR